MQIQVAAAGKMAGKRLMLTARRVQTETTPGSYGDGQGLYLQVAPGGSKSWVYRYQRSGRRRELGLGGVGAVSLAEARELAINARRMLAAGQDPIEAGRAARARGQLAAAKTVVFRDAAIRYIAAHRAGWRSAKHAKQWGSTLEAYTFPIFGSLPVEEIDVGLVLRVLEPIWETKPETANRVRQRVEAVLDWAKVRGYRQGDNPARWRGHLDHLLPKKSQVHRVEHHAALPYVEIGAFLAELRQQDSIPARALEFLILTASRTGEAIGADWNELNLADRLWTIPAIRMKSGKEHRVPLSAPAMSVVNTMAKIRLSDLVFPSAGRLGVNALRMVLQRMGRADLTVHGFRSTFRDWCAESTNFPREVAEMALSHTVGDAVERAYQRGDLMQKRAQLMQAWGRYCAARPVGEVVPIRGRK
jgi:integrase